MSVLPDTLIIRMQIIVYTTPHQNCHIAFYIKSIT